MKKLFLTAIVTLIMAQIAEAGPIRNWIHNRRSGGEGCSGGEGGMQMGYSSGGCSGGYGGMQQGCSGGYGGYGGGCSGGYGGMQMQQGCNVQTGSCSVPQMGVYGNSQPTLMPYPNNQTLQPQVQAYYTFTVSPQSEDCSGSSCAAPSGRRGFFGRRR